MFCVFGLLFRVPLKLFVYVVFFSKFGFFF